MKTKNIYAYNLLKANSLDFSPEENYLISRILENFQSININTKKLENCAESLLKTFNSINTAFTKKIDRICLTSKKLGSNRIEIISSATSEKTISTTLKTGYSCYINENSSLLSIKPSEIRVYSDISEICNSFIQENKKIQRSIYLLSQSNVKSGITIPLVSHNKILGFLFLNSVNENAFSELSNEEYFIIGYLQLIFSSLITSYSNENINFDDQILKKHVANINTLNFATLEKSLENYLNLSLYRNNVKVTIESIPNKDILISNLIVHYNIFYFLSILHTDNWDGKLGIQFSFEENFLKIRMTTSKNSTMKLKEGTTQNNNTPYQLEGDSIIFKIDCEEDVDKLKYSIV